MLKKTLVCSAIFGALAANALAQDESLILGPAQAPPPPSLILGPPAPGVIAATAPQTPTAPTTSPTVPKYAQATMPVADHATTVGGLVEYLETRLSPLEPMYFIWGPESPNIKFQLSMKYQIFGLDDSLTGSAPWIRGFHLGYSQTSFWDVSADSAPFFDSSYRPEFLYLYEQKDPQWLTGLSHFDLQAGAKHESNGKDGADSRSMNTVYIQSVFTFGDPGTSHSDGFFLAVAPRVWGYIFSLDDNPDMAEYRGYGDLRIITGWRGGLQLAAMGRMGNDWDKGALELDLSYPLRKISKDCPDLYAYGQFFTGYGDSLLNYNQSDTSYRIGIALVR